MYDEVDAKYTPANTVAMPIGSHSPPPTPVAKQKIPVPLNEVKLLLYAESENPPIDVHLYPVLKPFNEKDVLHMVAVSFHASHCALSKLLNGNVAPTPGGILT